MRKQDIRTGVVYAYQQGAGDHHLPAPCVIVSTAMHTRRRQNENTGTWCDPAESYEKAGRGYLGAVTGYPAVMVTHGFSQDDLIPAMLTVTSDALATGSLPDGLHLTILTSLTPVRGQYDEVRAAWDERQRQTQEINEREQRRRFDHVRRAQAVAQALSAKGIRATFDTWGGSDLTLPLDDAEKLVALLDRRSDR